MSFALDLRLGHRLALGFGLVLVLLLGIVALSWTRLAATRAELATIAQLRERAALAGDWKEWTGLNSNRTMAIVKSNGNAQVADYFTPRMKATSEQISKAQAELQAHIRTPEAKALDDEISRQRKDYVAARDEVLRLLKAEDFAAANLMAESRLAPAADKYIATIENFHRESQHEADAQAQAAADAIDAAGTQLLVLSAACIALGVVAAWLITRSVTVPLASAASAIHAMAQGNLTQPLQARGRNEVATMVRGLADMQSAWQAIVGRVRTASDNIATGSSQIAAGNGDLSQRTEEQAASLQQTAASMEQLSGTVNANADTARHATELAQSASAAAAHGGDVMAQVVATMGEISTGAHRIGQIIGVIDGIAFQTNILALNAAVEAARAGEQGRGFAVVASEVRSLAQRSAEAAREIKALIGTSVDTVEAGSRLVGDAGTAMTDIVEQVRKVSDLIGEIGSATREQAGGIDQVNTAVSQMDQVTQQNAALVEEAAAAADSLRQQAGQLVEMVAVFRLPQDAEATDAIDRARRTSGLQRPAGAAASRRSGLAQPAGHLST